MTNQPDCIQNFVKYCSCYEIPQRYAIWTGIGLLGAVNNRRIWIKQGDITITAALFLCLVGGAGDKKTTCMTWAKHCHHHVYPDIPTNASVESREAIIKTMASEEGTKVFILPDGNVVEYHPYMLFINELKNWVSFNMTNMISFLTDIFDQDYFKSSTIVRDVEDIKNPAVNIIACATTGWIMSKLKAAELTDGLCRRMLFIYSPEVVHANLDEARNRSIPRPSTSAEAKHAINEVRKHIKNLETFSGEFKWSKEAGEFFDEWYYTNKINLPDEPIMRGYRKTKDMQLLKVAMNIASARYDPTQPLEPQLILQVGDLEEALAHLGDNETQMPSLFSAAGRNDLAIPTQKIIEFIESKGGAIPYKNLLFFMESDFKPFEKPHVVKSLLSQERIFEDANAIVGGIKRHMIFSARRFAELKEQSRIMKEKTAQQATQLV